MQEEISNMGIKVHVSNRNKAIPSMPVLECIELVESIACTCMYNLKWMTTGEQVLCRRCEVLAGLRTGYTGAYEHSEIPTLVVEI